MFCVIPHLMRDPEKTATRRFCFLTIFVLGWDPVSRKENTMTNITETVFHPILDELLRKEPLPWGITGTGPYHVISSNGDLVASNVRSDYAEAIVQYARGRGGKKK